MAKGAIAKQEVSSKILSTFEGSFLYNDGKEIRIPIMENGELVQIKVALTCAKTNVGKGDDNALPGAELNFEAAAPAIEKPVAKAVNQDISDMPVPNEQEKANVADLLKALGLA